MKNEVENVNGVEQVNANDDVGEILSDGEAECVTHVLGESGNGGTGDEESAGVCEEGSGNDLA